MSATQGSLFDPDGIEPPPSPPPPSPAPPSTPSTSSTSSTSSTPPPSSPPVPPAAGTIDGEPPAEPPTSGGVPDPRADVFSWLQAWRDAGVLQAADVHIAATLARLSGMGAADRGLTGAEADVVLAVALAARAPRLGHVCLDLATVRHSVPAEVESETDAGGAASIDELPWPPDVDAWRAAVAGSSLVLEVDPSSRTTSMFGVGRPLVLAGSLLYLERYRVYEDHVAGELLRRAQEPPLTLTTDRAARAALFDAFGSSTGQRAAAEAGATGVVSVIVGGPGTGKTTTVAALLALLAADDPALGIALLAPTGKAAARMGESIAGLAATLRTAGVAGAEALADRLAGAEVSTIHRRLGYRLDGTFRHDRTNPLVHDVVIVDETSMVSLPLMARLLDAVRPDSRLVLVGDPGQLASVEAGSVLSDIAGPSADAAALGGGAPVGPLARCVTVLTESYRFPAGSAVGRFAAAIRTGDVDAALAVLSGDRTDPDQRAARTDGDSTVSPVVQTTADGTASAVAGDAAIVADTVVGVDAAIVAGSAVVETHTDGVEPVLGASRRRHRRGHLGRWGSCPRRCRAHREPRRAR